MIRFLLFAYLISSSLSAVAMDWYVTAGQSLQQVLNDARPGDNITLQAGATFRGTFTLPNKGVNVARILIRSSLMSSLPADQRVRPANAIFMAKLEAPTGGPALQAARGANNYVIQGLEMASASGIYTMTVVQLGSGLETTLDQLPYAITIDRCYIHGDPTVGGKRGVALNSRQTSIINSYLSNFKSTFQDTQAIGGWNGSGPFQIRNNYLEASGENVFFGGAKVYIPNLVPSNITISRNHLLKPLSWKSGDPSFAGTAWLVKSSFELKNARNVQFDSNVVENCWPNGQAGYAVVLSPRTENGAVSWAVVSGVSFTRNIFRNVAGVANIAGLDDTTSQGLASNLYFRDNIATNVYGHAAFAVVHGPRAVQINHNTILQTGLLVGFDGSPVAQNFIFINNISSRGTYGIFGSNKGEGVYGLSYYAPYYQVRANVIAGANAGIYPPGEYFPASIYAIGFVNIYSGNYALASTSPYIGKATDGSNPGADFTTVQVATAGVVR